MPRIVPIVRMVFSLFLLSSQSERRFYGARDGESLFDPLLLDRAPGVGGCQGQFEIDVNLELGFGAARPDQHTAAALEIELQEVGGGEPARTFAGHAEVAQRADLATAELGWSPRRESIDARHA